MQEFHYPTHLICNLIFIVETAERVKIVTVWSVTQLRAMLHIPDLCRNSKTCPSLDV